MALRTGTRLHAVLWVALLLVAQLASAQSVQVERVSPAVKTAAPGNTVTHVFVLRGSGTVRVRLTSEHGWPLLTRERTIALEAGRPYYFPVTLRVPEGVPAGTRDRLRLQADGASTDAFTEAAYTPGLEVQWPTEVAYIPPFGRFALEVANSGNGADVALVRLETLEGVPVFHARVALQAGERRKLRVAVAEVGVLRLRVRLERGGLERDGFISVEPARARRDGRFRLLGRLTAAYRYPGGLSFSLGAAGPLSDFAHSSVGAGYAPGSLPAGNLALSWQGGYLSAAFGPSYGLALGLNEGGVNTQISVSGPGLQGSFNLDVNGRGYGFGASAILADRASLRLYSDVQLGTEANEDRAFQPDRLAAELRFNPFQTELNGGLTYRFSYQGWPVRIATGFDAAPGRPVAFSLSGDTNPRPLSLGSSISWDALGLRDWSLAAASSSEQLDLNLPVPIGFGARLEPDAARAFAHALFDLPEPWSNLRAGVNLTRSSGRTTFSVNVDSETYADEGLVQLALGGQLAWPLDTSEFKLRLRTGGSYLRSRAELAWSPWRPSLRTALTLEVPAGGALLRGSAAREWYRGNTQLGLSAQLPLVLEVPPAVSQLFGGRNVGVVTGEVVLDGPAKLREGLVVRIGSYETRTDTAGRFRLELPPGRYTVALDRRSLPAALLPLEGEVEVEVQTKQATNVRLRVAARSVLVGQVQVLSEPGRKPPPQRFPVEIGDALGRTTSFFTDPEGGFSLPALPPGRYTVRLLEKLLPPGWEVVRGEARVQLRPGETGRVELTVHPPKRKVYTGERVQILEVRPETERVPPGALPLVEVSVKGRPDRIVVTLNNAIVGILLPDPDADGLWRGRVRVPENADGSLAFQVEAHGIQVSRFPFFLDVTPNAPPGVLRTLPVARPGQTLPVAAHWYAPVEASWLELDGTRVELSGEGADWEGWFTVPETASGRLRLTAFARLADGRELMLERWILIR